ncbi:MAG: hypothetical protein Q8O19_05770 [Rectinemataceae bacterium]|nr:hypothetical protein [Rectinemataceae bacterium]
MTHSKSENEDMKHSRNLTQEERIKVLRQSMANLNSQEAIRWGNSLHKAGARLIAKLPDGIEFELPIPGIQDANLKRIGHE